MSTKFVFNDELFISQLKKIANGAELNDQHWDKLKESLVVVYPRCYFSFINREVIEEFIKHDGQASIFKKRFLHYGVLAVFFAFCSFALAVVEPIYILPAAKSGSLSPNLANTIALFAAACGIASVIMGLHGAGLADRKENWENLRLICEALRQWQSQYRCTHVKEILEASISKEPDAIAKFESARAAEFEQFKKNFIDNISATRIQYVDTEKGGSESYWLSAKFDRRAKEALTEKSDLIPYSRSKAETSQSEECLKELFDAHDQIRFESQVSYSNLMLGDGPFFQRALVQEKRLSIIGIITVIIAFIAHLLIIVSVLSGWEFLKVPQVYIAAVWSALLALAVRVLEDGFKPSAHLARLRLYNWEIKRHRARFLGSLDFNRKHEEMLGFEEAAGYELCTFMKTIFASRFIF